MLLNSRRAALSIGLAASALLLAGCGDDPPPPSPAAAPPSAASPTGPPAPAEAPLGTFTVSCNTSTGQTASGRPNGPGLAAVDTDRIPLGTRLRVEKVGVVTAADRGGAVDGMSIDVWSASEAECTAFGKQQLKVWRLG